MGAGASAGAVSEEQELQMFQGMKEQYEKLKTEGATDEQIAEQLRTTYESLAASGSGSGGAGAGPVSAEASAKLDEALAKAGADGAGAVDENAAEAPAAVGQRDGALAAEVAPTSAEEPVQAVSEKPSPATQAPPRRASVEFRPSAENQAKLDAALAAAGGGGGDAAAAAGTSATGAAEA